MDIGIISVRYARALLRFAMENKEEDAVYHEMERMSQAFLRIEKLQSILLNPILTENQVIDILKGTCIRPKEVITNSSLSFIRLVAKKKRANLMMFISNSYVSLYRKEKNIIKGSLTVSSKVNKDTEQKLKKIIESRSEGSNVEFDVRTDEQILGGFILEYDTYRLDASLRTQINKIRRSLMS